MPALEAGLRSLQASGSRLRLEPVLERQFLDDYIEKSLQPVRIGMVLAAVLYCLFGILDVWVVPEVAHRIWIIRYAIVVPLLAAALGFSFHPAFHRWMQPAMIVTVLILGAGILAMIAIAGELGRAYYYAGLILVIEWNYTLARLTFRRAILVGWALVLAYEVLAIVARPVPPTTLINNDFFFVSANIVGMVACYYSERSQRMEYLGRRIIEVERQRSEALLTNCLPVSIAERLKRGGATIADSFDDVTVLFCDIVEFTRLCQALPALEVVALLNEVFTAFDALAAKHGLEKIKTIGDSYMVVGGVPQPRPDHAEAIAEFALDVQHVLSRFARDDGRPLQVRMGIHTGSVVAGVIGSRKFWYDVWGDAVNTASRMEQHGIAGTIQVSQTTYERLAGRYEFARRGAVHMKGRGSVLCWTLLRRVQANAVAPASDAIETSRSRSA